MAPESSDRDEHLTPEELLTDPLYVKQHAETYRLAARELLGRYTDFEGEAFDAANALVGSELNQRSMKYPRTFNTVATYRGLNGSSMAVWTAADFPGDDAILGPNPNSVESKLRAQFSAAFEGVDAFVPPTEEEA